MIGYGTQLSASILKKHIASKMVVPFCQTTQLLQDGGLWSSVGFVPTTVLSWPFPAGSCILLLCPYFLLCWSLLPWHSQIDAWSILPTCIQYSWYYLGTAKSQSPLSIVQKGISEFQILLWNCWFSITLGKSYNKVIRLWKILLQLTSKAHPVAFSLRCHNSTRQQNLIVVTIICDSRLDNLIKDVTFSKSPVYNHNLQCALPCFLCSWGCHIELFEDSITWFLAVIWNS